MKGRNCTMSDNTKKPFYKKGWFIILLIILAIGVLGIDREPDVVESNYYGSKSIELIGTTSQKNAIREAVNHLNHSSFSKKGLISKLEFDGYSTEDATYAVEKCGANWNEQAKKFVESYLENKVVSRDGLIYQLETAGFTTAQATLGADYVDLKNRSSSKPSSERTSVNETVSQQNAVQMAKEYLEYTAFSKKGLIEQLEFEGFSNADASYGVAHCGADWNEQAEKCAERYLDNSAYSRKGLIEQLEYEGFTHSQAVHGAISTGL